MWTVVQVHLSGNYFGTINQLYNLEETKCPDLLYQMNCNRGLISRLFYYRQKFNENNDDVYVVISGARVGALD